MKSGAVLKAKILIWFSSMLFTIRGIILETSLSLSAYTVAHAVLFLMEGSVLCGFSSAPRSSSHTHSLMLNWVLLLAVLFSVCVLLTYLLLIETARLDRTGVEPTQRKNPPLSFITWKCTTCSKIFSEKLWTEMASKAAPFCVSVMLCNNQR